MNMPDAQRTRERTIELAGLETTIVGPANARLAVVLLHGYAMKPADLAPFAHSLTLPLLFLLPRGPLAAPSGGYAWWEVDLEERNAAILAGPRDLANIYPRGLDTARRRMSEFLDAVAAEFKPAGMVMGGFSQGGMLTLDLALRGTKRIDAIFLLSASRIAWLEWQPRCERLRGLPVFVSHGEADSDLAFRAGEALRDFATGGGAEVTWVPFAGGHETPLIVWRGLRKFLSPLLKL